MPEAPDDGKRNCICLPACHAVQKPFHPRYFCIPMHNAKTHGQELCQHQSCVREEMTTVLFSMKAAFEADSGTPRFLISHTTAATLQIHIMSPHLL